MNAKIKAILILFFFGLSLHSFAQCIDEVDDELDYTSIKRNIKSTLEESEQILASDDLTPGVKHIYESLSDDAYRLLADTVSREAESNSPAEKLVSESLFKQVSIAKRWNDYIVRLKTEHKLGSEWMALVEPKKDGNSTKTVFFNEQTNEFQEHSVAGDNLQLVEDFSKSIKSNAEAYSRGVVYDKENNRVTYDENSAEAVSTLNAAFFIQTIMGVNPRFQGQMKKPVQAEIYAALTQTSLGLVRDGVQLASIIKTAINSEVTTLSSANKVLTTGSKALGVIGVVGDYVNLGLSIWELSGATTSLEKVNAGTRVGIAASLAAFDSVAISTSLLGFSAVAEILGPLAVPLAGISVGIPQLATAYESFRDGYDKTAEYFDKIDESITDGGFSVSGDTLSFNSDVVVKKIDFSTNKVTYGDVRTSKTVSGSGRTVTDGLPHYASAPYYSSTETVSVYKGLGLSDDKKLSGTVNNFILPTGIKRKINLEKQAVFSRRAANVPAFRKMFTHYGHDFEHLFYVFIVNDYGISGATIDWENTPVDIVLDDRSMNIIAPDFKKEDDNKDLHYTIESGTKTYTLYLPSVPIKNMSITKANEAEYWVFDVTRKLAYEQNQSKKTINENVRKLIDSITINGTNLSIGNQKIHLNSIQGKAAVTLSLYDGHSDLENRIPKNPYAKLLLELDLSEKKMSVSALLSDKYTNAKKRDAYRLAFHMLAAIRHSDSKMAKGDQALIHDGLFNGFFDYNAQKLLLSNKAVVSVAKGEVPGPNYDVVDDSNNPQKVTYRYFSTATIDDTDKLFSESDHTFDMNEKLFLSDDGFFVQDSLKDDNVKNTFSLRLDSISLPLLSLSIDKSCLGLKSVGDLVDGSKTYQSSYFIRDINAVSQCNTDYTFTNLDQKARVFIFDDAKNSGMNFIVKANTLYPESGVIVKDGFKYSFMDDGPRKEIFVESAGQKSHFNVNESLLSSLVYDWDKADIYISAINRVTLNNSLGLTIYVNVDDFDENGGVSFIGNQSDANVTSAFNGQNYTQTYLDNSQIAKVTYVNALAKDNLQKKALRTSNSEGKQLLDFYLDSLYRGVCFYTDPGFSGSRLCINSSTDYISDDFNDKLSSLKIEGDNVLVKVYSSHNHSGSYSVISEEQIVNFNYFDGVNDNEISSIEILDKKDYNVNNTINGSVCFYTDTDFGGNEHCYSDKVDVLSGGQNNTFSSMKLADNQMIALYRDSNYKNGGAVYGVREVSNFDHFYGIDNDSISSFQFLSETKLDDVVSGTVCFYEFEKYLGKKSCFTSSTSHLEDVVNDSFSSLRMAEQVILRVFNDINYNENQWYTTLSDIENIEYFLNFPGINDNSISSVKFISEMTKLPDSKDKVCFYSGRNFQGTKSCYETSTETLDTQSDNSFSSVRVAEGTTVEVFYKDHYDGESKLILAREISDFHQDAEIRNDDISSLKIW